MYQSTHEFRRMNWMNIINQCKNRPVYIPFKYGSSAIIRIIQPSHTLALLSPIHSTFYHF